MATNNSNNNNFRLNGLNPLAYMGVNPVTPVAFICRPFDPTSTDYANFTIGTLWENTDNYNIWFLVAKVNFKATWVKIGSSAGNIETLTSNSGGTVFPAAGNINVVGDGTTITGVGNPGTSTITFSVLGSVATTYDGNTGSATPSSNVLNIKGDGTTVTTSATGSTVTITALDTGTLTGLETDDGHTVTPTSGVIVIHGGTGIITSGTVGPNTVTISATGIINFNYTNVTHTASPYTVLSTDEYLSVDCSGGAVTLKFPNAATSGRGYVVKDRTGNAATNNITVTTVGGSVDIDGATTFVMNTNFESINILGNSSSYEVF